MLVFLFHPLPPVSQQMYERLRPGEHLNKYCTVAASWGLDVLSEQAPTVLK